MLFYLRDVYWGREGRSSIDTVIVGTSLAGILLLAASPFSVQEAEYHAPRTAVFILLALNYVAALICFVKGKPVVGAIGLLIPFVALFGAIRLAKPSSPWARWFYEPDHGPERLRAHRDAKRRRAQQRYDFGWPGRLERGVADIVGGRPSPEPADGEQ